MSLRFEGDRTFAMPPDRLWPRLRDAAFLVHCIPDATVQGQAERDRAQCTVRPGFSFVRGVLEVTLQIVDAHEPTSVKFKLLSKGVGSSSDVECELALAAHDAGSQVHWIAEVKQLGGLLKMAPSGLVRGAAQKVIEDVWTGIAARLRELPGESKPPE
jgi:carbon monoxide dehydrogenase subunit G